MNKKGFKPFSGLVSWWKGRHFYFPQEEDLDTDIPATATIATGRVSPLRRITKLQQLRQPITRSLSIDSARESVESMDSVTASYWNPGDETSESTEPASNTGYHADFLVEHLGFLSSQTQPREVEIVYRN